MQQVGLFNLGVCCTEMEEVMKGKRTVRQDDFLPVNHMYLFCIQTKIFKVSDSDIRFFDDEDTSNHLTQELKKIEDETFSSKEEELKPGFGKNKIINIFYLTNNIKDPSYIIHHKQKKLKMDQWL